MNNKTRAPEKNVASKTTHKKTGGQVIIIEDHPLFCEALRMVAEKALPESEVLCSHDGSAISGLLSSAPGSHLLIIDLILPDVDWRAVLPEIREDYPDLHILAVSNLEDKDTIRDAISCGANGFLPKSTPVEVIINVIRIVADGGTYVPAQTVTGRVSFGRQKIKPRGFQSGAMARDGLLENLTPRQLEVLKELAEGKSNKAISESLGISLATAKLHVTAILQRLNLANRTEAALLAHRLLNKE